MNQPSHFIGNSLNAQGGTSVGNAPAPPHVPNGLMSPQFQYPPRPPAPPGAPAPQNFQMQMCQPMCQQPQFQAAFGGAQNMPGQNVMTGQAFPQQQYQMMYQQQQQQSQYVQQHQHHQQQSGTSNCGLIHRFCLKSLGKQCASKGHRKDNSVQKPGVLKNKKHQGYLPL